MSTEIWRPVPVGGCSHMYEVSNLGRVRSLRSGKVLKPGPTSKGYLSVVLYRDDAVRDGRSHSVHKLVCRAFNGEPRHGYQVDHVNGNKADNHASNLQWVTASENMQRAVDNGLLTSQKGDFHTNAKLTREQVLAIRAEPQKRGVLARLAREHNVSEGTIRQARKGTTYRDIK